MGDYILAEFKGNYRAPHPSGVRDQNITKEFHVKVKMKRDSLQAPGLCGLFSTYYKELLRKQYPDMIDTYFYEMIQATELNGAKIDHPKAMSHDDLLAYINKRQYPINPLLYSGTELRNEVILYEQDPKGQQHLQGKLEAQKGNMIAIASELHSLEDVLIVVGKEPQAAPADPVITPVESKPNPTPAAPAPGEDVEIAQPTVIASAPKSKGAKKEAAASGAIA